MEYTLQRALEGIANAGFEYVELVSIPRLAEHVRPEMTKDDLKTVSELLEEYSLSTVSLSAHVNGLVKNPQDTEFAIKSLKERIGLASQLGCKYINTGSWTTNKQSFYDTVYALVDLCKHHNMILGLEVGEPGLTATGEQLIELLKPIQAENVGINYDTGNIRCLTGIEPEVDLPSTLGRLVHMHVKDQIGGKAKEIFPALGDGEVNFANVFNIINKSHFKGPFTVEIEMPSKNPSQRDNDIRLSFDNLKKYLEH
jgi:sugar phosphate isomerase/epimerase